MNRSIIVLSINVMVCYKVEVILRDMIGQCSTFVQHVVQIFLYAQSATVLRISILGGRRIGFRDIGYQDTKRSDMSWTYWNKIKSKVWMNRAYAKSRMNRMI